MREKTGLRAAIYARYSTDLQSAASITDQIRICRRLRATVAATASSRS